MVRSLYSGVSSMKAHQARMDVIGNNIANVNTYGFKGSRATFRDVYYQTMRGAAGASNSAGGSNPSQVGYGAQLGSIDILMGGSSFTMTDNPTDLAIDGEGFMQVQDPDGNIFYTRAGQTRFDSAGNLVDSQGNFVLGVSGNPLGKPSASDKIQIQVPPVSPSGAKYKDKVNGVGLSITSKNPTKDGNVGFTIVPGENMTDGVKAVAEVGTAGIVIKLNPKEKFANEGELNAAINAAISKYTQAVNGKDHPAGDFTFSFDPKEAFDAGGLTGAEICSTDYAVQAGKITGWPTDVVMGGFKPTGTTGDKFSGNGAVKDFTVEYDKATNKWLARVVFEGPDDAVNTDDITYVGEIDATRLESGKFNMKNEAAGASADDYIEFDRPSFKTMNETHGGTLDADGTPPANIAQISETNAAVIAAFATTTTTPSTESKAMGLSSKKYVLAGGTEGGDQGIENLTGIGIGPDGVITAQHAVHGDIIVGRIDLVTFANPQGLLASGGNYFTPTPNSGKMSHSAPGTDGSGALVSGALELSNVDLSREFSDMITTQRGFQANSRIITVSDTMLEELVNLKR